MTDTSRINIECPDCGSQLRVERKHVGGRKSCPQSDKVFEVTMPTGSSSCSDHATA